MPFVYNRQSHVPSVKTGSGLVNKIINGLPFELHYPGGYQFLGPGTRLEERLARGDRGINKLDQLALAHDLAYAKNKDLDKRHLADRELENAAWERVKAPDAKVGERVAAYITTNLMKAKRKLGMGSKQRKRRSVKRIKKKKRPKQMILPLPNRIGGAGNVKSGGVLPLLPILGALGTIGTIANNADSVVKLARNLIGAKKDLQGKGMRLAPYQKGRGMRLAPYKKSGYGLVFPPEENYAGKKKKTSRKNGKRRGRGRKK